MHHGLSYDRGPIFTGGVPRVIRAVVIRAAVLYCTAGFLLERTVGEVPVTLPELATAMFAAATAGLINALAGGGTLISFPVLLALGVPPIAANVTNAVALCPGYFGATVAQRQNLAGQRPRLWVCIPMALAGGLLGASILLLTRERTFELLIPYMIAAAAVLLAIQERVRAMVLRRLQDPKHASHSAVAGVAVLLAGIYGGFFSGGMSVIVLAVLGLTLDDTLTRLNALKQAVALSVNVAATVFFLFSGEVVWGTAAVMAVGALLGGAVGGRLAGKMQPTMLRWTVVTMGLLVASVYWLR